MIALAIQGVADGLNGAAGSPLFRLFWLRHFLVLVIMLAAAVIAVLAHQSALLHAAAAAVGSFGYTAARMYLKSKTGVDVLRPPGDTNPPPG